MYNICHLKPFKGPEPLLTDKKSEESIAIEIDVEDIDKKSPPEHMGEMSGDERHSTADSIARRVEVIKTQEEDCIVQALAVHKDSDVDETVMEFGEDKEWFQKDRPSRKPTGGQSGKYTVIGTSFHGLKPREWLGDEVIDAYLFCVVKKASRKGQAVSSVLSTSVLAGRAGQMNLKKGIIQKDIVLLPFNTSEHWVIVFAELYVQNEDISTVEATEDAMNTFRREIAICLLKESDSVEDYCMYCNFVTCPEKTDCMMVQCESCKRWTHIPCLPNGINEENLHDEDKEYKCNKCA